MQKSVGLIYTTAIVVEPIMTLFREILPGVKAINFVDEGILEIMARVGKVNHLIIKRICNLALIAEEVKVDICMVTCSASSPAVDVTQKMISVPILKINQPMIEKAIEIGKNIGLLLTDRASVESSRNLILEVAERKEKKITINTILQEEALSARLCGDVDKHDKLLLESAKEIANTSDVIVLAQASMAGFGPKLERITGIPVLTSPRLAIEKVKEMLK